MWSYGLKIFVLNNCEGIFGSRKRRWLFVVERGLAFYINKNIKL